MCEREGKEQGEAGKLKKGGSPFKASPNWLVVYAESMDSGIVLCVQPCESTALPGFWPKEISRNDVQ